MRLTKALLTCTLLAAAISPALADGDPVHGKVVFNQCLVCHTIEPGKWKIGPSLWGVVGRPSGTLPGYTYSAAMKNFNHTWDEAELNTYLTAPMKVVVGTKMTFAGISNEQNRQDVIAYLKTLK